MIQRETSKFFFAGKFKGENVLMRKNYVVFGKNIFKI